MDRKQHRNNHRRCSIRSVSLVFATPTPPRKTRSSQCPYEICVAIARFALSRRVVCTSSLKHIRKPRRIEEGDGPMHLSGGNASSLPLWCPLARSSREAFTAWRNGGLALRFPAPRHVIAAFSEPSCRFPLDFEPAHPRCGNRGSRSTCAPISSCAGGHCPGIV